MDNYYGFSDWDPNEVYWRQGKLQLTQGFVWLTLLTQDECDKLFRSKMINYNEEIKSEYVFDIIKHFRVLEFEKVEKPPVKTIKKETKETILKYLELSKENILSQKELDNLNKAIEEFKEK